MRTELGNLINGKNGKVNKTANIYTATLANLRHYGRPHQFVRDGYKEYLRQNANPSNSVSGKIFEWLICETLMREGATPFYYQARLEHVPNASFDIVLYEPRRPVVLSCKTSLRERYKQADLEGMALNQVYRNAECYLITLDHTEARRTVGKIKEYDVAGLTACHLADTEEFTELVGKLANREFLEASVIMPIRGRLVQGLG